MAIRQSLVYSYMDRYASLAIAIVSSMVIARLLTPKDIGVFSVTMVLLGFLAMVRDMGVGGYLVQEKELTIERIRAVWTVQLGIGLFLTLVVLVASQPVAAFYDEPRMGPILLLMAASYAINPFGSLVYAWQIREMRFGALAITRFMSTLVGAVISVYLAWLGKGPISLAFGSLGSTLTNALMAMYFRPGWFPWFPGTKELRRVLAFGTRSTGITVFQVLGGSLPELLLGKLQGMTATGLFSRAAGLVAMFDRLVMSGISSVAISWFAKQSRENGDISEPFVKATSYVTAIGWSFAAGTVFLAHPAMRLLYGDQWDGAVDLTRLLAGSLACGLPAAMCMAALMSVGAVYKALKVTVISTIISVVMTIIGASVGLLGLGLCMMLASALNSVLWLRTTRQVVQFKWSALLRELRDSAAVGIGAGAAPALAFAVYGAQPENIWIPMLIGATGGTLGFFGAIIVFKHPLSTELTMLVSKFQRNKTNVGSN